MKTIKVVVSIVLVTLIVFSFWETYDFLYIPASDKEELVTINVAPGTGLYKLARTLSELGIIKDRKKFVYLARFFGKTESLKVGEYQVSPSMRPEEVLDIVTSGKSVESSITIQEGRNIFEIAEIFEQNGFGKSKDFLEAARDKKFIKELLRTNLPSFEGYLFPETYKITKYTGAKELIRMMVDRFLIVAAEIEAKGRLRFDRHKMVTLASIVEKETGAIEERRLISSIIHNRLRKKMRLQMDPTVIYGYWVRTGEYKNNIKKKDLSVADDYNTYMIRGLPMGPISNPGRASMEAALDPANSNFLYFVSRNDGTHVFSATLKKHNDAVKKFQQRSSARKGKSWRDLAKRRRNQQD